MFVSTFFVETNKATTIFVLNNIVFCLVLALMCILVTFCISNSIAVKLHDIVTFSFVNMLRQLFKDTRHHANILLGVTKSQNCKSYLLPIIPIWILAFAVKLAGANIIVALNYKKNFKPFPK